MYDQIIKKFQKDIAFLKDQLLLNGKITLLMMYVHKNEEESIKN